MDDMDMENKVVELSLIVYDILQKDNVYYNLLQQTSVFGTASHLINDYKRLNNYNQQLNLKDYKPFIIAAAQDERAFVSLFDKDSQFLFYLLIAVKRNNRVAFVDFELGRIDYKTNQRFNYFNFTDNVPFSPGSNLSWESEEQEEERTKKELENLKKVLEVDCSLFLSGIKQIKPKKIRNQFLNVVYNDLTQFIVTKI